MPQFPMFKGIGDIENHIFNFQQIHLKTGKHVNGKMKELN